MGVVPTMGALHDGHRSLIQRAAAECDVVAVSIFVNPTQFGDPADLANYPRTLDADLLAIASSGGQLVFAPSTEEMYPDPPGVAPTTVSVPALASRWEGASRPGHFDGVATVVVKLLAAAGRCRAYFGEKDFQQLALVTRVVRDLALPTEVVGCPTVRDPDGLALSSRNSRLSPEQRRAALVLSRALRAGAARVRAGDPPRRGGDGDAPGGGDRARRGAGLRRAGGRGPRAGRNVGHRRSPAADRGGHGGPGPSDRQPRSPSGL